MNKPARFSYFDFDSISIRLVGYESRFDYRFDFFQKKIKHEPKINFRFERININILKVSGKRDSLADVTVFPPSDQTRSLGAAVAGIDSRIFAHCMRLGNLLPFCSKNWIGQSCRLITGSLRKVSSSRKKLSSADELSMSMFGCLRCK